jgi:hypothetical protein
MAFNRVKDRQRIL